MKIISADITGSLIINNQDVTTTVESSSIWSGSIASRVTNLEQFSSSLDATFATDQQLNQATASLSSSIASLSGSYLETSASFVVVSGSYSDASGSLSTRTTTLEQASSSLNTASGSFSTRVTNNELTGSSLTIASGSFSTRVTTIESKYATTGSNLFTDPQYVSQSSNAIGFTSTASLYTDGGLRVTRDAYVSGTLYLNNLTVFGTSSIQYATSSQLNVGTNIITVNTNTPVLRFGGLAVYDSGSTSLTGSILWDSEDNQWIYSNPSGSTYDSALFLVGPRNSNVLGNEVGINCNFLSKGNGMHHMTSSAIFDDGAKTCFYGSSIITSTGVGCFSTSVCAPSFVGGTISGTTGTFTNDVYVQEAGNALLRVHACTTSTPIADIELMRGTCTTWGVDIYGDYRIRNTGGDLIFQYGDTGVTSTRLTIASTGVACFACQVCAPAFVGGTVSGTTGTFTGNISTSGAGIGATPSANFAIDALTGTTAVIQVRASTQGSGDGTVTAVVTRAVNCGANDWAVARHNAHSHIWYGGTGANTALLTLTSTGVGCFASTVCASSFSGAGTGLTGTASSLSIGGNAATATTANTVAWANISAGTRTNYTLKFQPPSEDFAGFEFTGTNGSGAGYFLIRGTSDSGVYTGEGITLVADQGWATIAQRTRSDKGVRIMTGATSTARMCIVSSGETLFSSNICVTGILSMATSGTNYIRMGVFPNSTTNTGEAWIGRAADRNSGTMTVQLGGNSASNRSFEVVDYAWSVVLASVSSAGTFSASGDVVAYASDCRLKSNIKPITNALGKIKCINGVTYDWKDGIECLGFTPSSKNEVGVLAQEVQKVLPEVVKPAPFDQMNGKSKSGDNYLTVKYEKIVPLLIEAIKEQQCQIEYLKCKIG